MARLVADVIGSAEHWAETLMNMEHKCKFVGHNFDELIVARFYGRNI